MASWQVSLDADLTNGALTLNRRHLVDALRGRKDGPMRITIEPLTATRSQQANRYYWGVVLKLLSEHTGYHPDELHEHFKREFLGRDLILADGSGEVIQETKVGQSTAKLDVSDFYAYVERIREVAAQMGVDIPDPTPERTA